MTQNRFRKKMTKDSPIGRGIKMGTGLGRMKSGMQKMEMGVLGGQIRLRGSRNRKINGELQEIKGN